MKITLQESAGIVGIVLHVDGDASEPGYLTTLDWLQKFAAPIEDGHWFVTQDRIHDDFRGRILIKLLQASGGNAEFEWIGLPPACGQHQHPLYNVCYTCHDQAAPWTLSVLDIVTGGRHG